jgi:Tfp pilus assembly protein PilX
MNPHCFLRLLFSNRHQSDQNTGFVMPLVIMTGLILTIIGFAMMQRASTQKIDASNQVATAQALGIAEAGVARVMNLPSTANCTEELENASDLDGQPIPQGKYRLVDNSYLADPAPGNWNLTIEGVANTGQANEAKAKVKVTIRLDNAPPDPQDPCTFTLQTISSWSTEEVN